MLRIMFLGTSASVPTKTRNTPCLYFEHDYDVRFLMDVGECCQKSLITYGLKFMRINHIFISHWHADHFAGLIGLIQTMGLEGRDKPLHIYGPRRSKEFMDKLLSLGYYIRNYPIEVHELKHGDVIEFERFVIKAFRTFHRIPSLGYVFEEKPVLKANMEKAAKFGLKTGPLIGKLKRGESVTFRGQVIKPEDVIEEVRGLKVVYTGDTAYNDELIKSIEGADLLIAEATFDDEDKEPYVYHMTVSEAVALAKKSYSKKLIVTHISRRYEGEGKDKYEKRLKDGFENSEIAYDGMEVILKR